VRWRLKLASFVYYNRGFLRSTYTRLREQTSFFLNSNINDFLFGSYLLHGFPRPIGVVRVMVLRLEKKKLPPLYIHGTVHARNKKIVFSWLLLLTK